MHTHTQKNHKTNDGDHMQALKLKMKSFIIYIFLGRKTCIHFMQPRFLIDSCFFSGVLILRYSTWFHQFIIQELHYYFFRYHVLCHILFSLFRCILKSDVDSNRDEKSLKTKYKEDFNQRTFADGTHSLTNNNVPWWRSTTRFPPLIQHILVHLTAI